MELFGERLAIFYDIGCSFSATLRKSKLLGKKVEDSKVITPVPSFHGHAHSRPCQLDHHPLYRPDLGIEDGEVCERIFSQSNSYSSTTRFATEANREASIHSFCERNNEDRYANIGESCLNCPSSFN